ncbi:MAG: TrkH family potassium uptake protein [Elainellaceae cyanobacterium]
MALVSIPVCIVFNEYYAILAFLLTAIISIGIGQWLYRRFRREKAAQFRQALLIVALSWLILFLLGAIPYLLIAFHLSSLPETPQTVREFQNVWNALFESVSGFTSTGLTMARDSSQLPHCLQWWRSFTQWIGGVGLIVLTLTVLEPSANISQLYSAEAREEKLAPSLRQTAQEIWKIYLLYTGLSILLLKLVGMPGWAAVNHGLTAIATGGFAITGNSFQTYSASVQIVTILIMITGAVSFLTHTRLLRHRQLSALWIDTRHRVFWFLLSTGTLVLLFEHYWFAGSWQWLDSAFQWTSALTTCGLSTIQEENWSPIAALMMSLAMVFGAISGSTVGGLKLDRVAVLYKSVVWHLRLMYRESPDELRYEIDGTVLSEIEAHRHLKSATVLATLWLTLLGVGTVVLFHAVEPTYRLSDVLFEAASALGTSGLSIGIANPDLFWLGKLTLMLLMWMGRLEIISVLILFAWFTRSVRAIGHSRSGNSPR